MHDRLDAANELVKQGRYDEAARAFEWLWHNMERIEPGMSGVRVSFMAKNMEDLIAKYPPARTHFEKIRDESAGLAERSIAASSEHRFDWIVLNEILSEREGTLAWFDGVKDDERYASVLDQVAARLIPLLRAHDRLPDIGRIYKDPVARLRGIYADFQPPPHIAADPYPDPDPRLEPASVSLMREALRKILDDLPKHVIEEAALMVASLLAAGRDLEADAVEREARKLDPSESMRAALQKARGKVD